ncbi:MAG: GNAT family N-acetyltransferase [Candidatus Kariarchaeaceae archaeon]
MTTDNQIEKNLNITAYSKKNLPQKMIEKLAKMTKMSADELLGLPTPTLEYYILTLNLPTTSDREEFWVLATDGENLIGIGKIFYNIKFDNQNLANWWVYVLPEERRRGVGTKIFNELMKNKTSKITLLGADVLVDSPGTAFAHKMLNVKVASVERFAVSDITKFNKDEIKKEADQLMEKVSKKGYEIIYFPHADFSEIDLAEFSKLGTTIVNLMPREDSEVEDSEYPPERMLEIYDVVKKGGSLVHTFVARVKETKELVGFTEFAISKYNPTLAYQWGTGVLPAHQRNGLGYTLKLQSLSFAKNNTEVELWETGNNHGNEPMLKVNNKLGYKESRKLEFLEAKV